MLANPAGERVVAGSATFQRSGDTLTVKQATDRAIVDWQSFSIGAGELTKFVQPGASSAILNRVVSGNPSALLGRMEANGKVFLINPNGILVGSGAVINTNGFVASTRDLPNAQFMAGGDMKFVGDSTGAIQNFGRINAGSGDVFLIAQSVENVGAIDAPKGTVGLAAGNEVLLRHSGDERLFVQTTVNAGPQTAKGVENSGIITAVQAELRAAGGNVYALAVNNKGVIHATGIAEKDGRVYLTASGGNVQSSGSVTARDSDGTGGSVVMTGDRVALTGNAMVNVSGETGGGTALVGGDYRGSNPDIANAQTTLVGRNAVIKADAGERGDGGKVIVWADDTTVFNGRISARGGAEGGNGGFAEVSGKQALGFNGSVDLRAPAGKLGTLLLDPKNVRVQTGGATAGTGDVDEFSDTPSQDQTVSPAALAASGASVEIQANNDIAFNESVALGAGASLRARAGRTITMDAFATITTQGEAVTLIANENVGVDANNRDAGPGVISMHSLAAINSNGGNVTLHARTNPTDLGTGQFITAGSINAGAGTVRIVNDGPGADASAGTITAGELRAARVEVSAGSQIFLTTATNAIGTLFVENNGQMLVRNAQALTIDGSGLTVGRGDVTITTSAGDITQAGAALIPAGVLTGTFTLDAAGKLNINDGVYRDSDIFGTLNGASVPVIFRAGGDVNINAGLIRAKNLTVTAGGNIAFQAPAGGHFGIVAQDINPNGLVTFTAGGAIASTADSTITARNLTLTANGGAVDLKGVVNAARLDATATGNISVDHATGNALGTLGAITSGGNIAITDTSIATGLTIAGRTQSTSANGNITIKTSGNVQFIASANCRVETGANGTITFDAAEGRILDGTTPSFIAGKLLITGRELGGATNPLNTQVSRVSAKATASGGLGGFIRMTNNENAAGALAIGGVDNFGMQANGRDSTGQCINLANNGSIVVDQGTFFARHNTNFNAGSLTLNATGAASDIVTSTGIFSVAAIADGAMTVTGGRDVLLGAGTGIGGLSAGGTLNVNAGRSVMINGNAMISGLGDRSAVNVTAADAINITPAGQAAVRSSGQGAVTLTANSLDLNNGSATTPVVNTNEAGTDGTITLKADRMNIAGRVSANTSRVTIAQRTGTRPMFVGAEDASGLSISDAELDRIRAGSLQMGDLQANPGTGYTVNGSITRPGAATYDAIAFNNAGAVNVQANIDVGSAPLTITALSGNVQGAGNLTGGNVELFSSTASIDLSGDIAAQTLNVSSPGGSINLSGRVNAAALDMRAGGGNITVDNNNNNIITLSGALFDREFLLRDSIGGLTVAGLIDGGASSSGKLEVRGGNLVLQGAARIFFGGAGKDFRLYSDTGFVNLAGANVLVPENGGRWLLYTPSPGVTQLNGIMPDFTMNSVDYPTVPANAGNGLVYASARIDPPAVAAETAPANASEPIYIPPPPRLFRLASLGTQETVYDSILRRLSQVPRRDGSIFDAPRGEALAFVELMKEFTDFMENDLQIALQKIESQKLNFENSVNDRLAELIVGLSTRSAVNKTKELSNLIDGLGSGEATMRQVADVAAQIMKDVEDVVGEYKRAAEREREVAIRKAADAVVAEAARFANGKIVPGPGGVPLIVPGSSGITPFLLNPRMRLPNGNMALGNHVSDTQMRDMAAATGGVLSTFDVSRIVAAGAGNLTPGVVAAIVAAGGGNFSSEQIAGIVAAGGGNLQHPAALTAVIDATMVAAGAGNIVAAGAGNIVAAGGGNMVAAGGLNMVAAGGLNLVAAGGLNFIDIHGNNIVAAGAGNMVAAGAGNMVAAGAGNMVAAGGLNLTASIISSMVAAGGLNMVAAGGLNFTPNDLSKMVAAGGLNMVAAGAGNMVAAGGLNMVAAGGLNFTPIAAGIVAAGAGNLRAANGLSQVDIAAGIVAAGAGNLQNTLSQLVAAGAGNLTNLSSMVAAGAGNIVAAGAGNAIQANNASLIADMARGNGLVNNGGMIAAPFNPGAMFQGIPGQ